jgi:hypothetical protein
MNKNFPITVAILALVSLAGCGNPAATGETSAGSATELSRTLTAKASATSSIQETHVLTPAGAVENGASASSTAPKKSERAQDSEAGFDARNSKFSLDGETVLLRNGLSQVPAAPGSASSITTRTLGKEARGDLTGDGNEDVAYFVTRGGGGSGQFYYVVAAIHGTNGYKTTNAYPVGDRIKPQSIRINASEVQVKFVGREKGQPMSASPSRESVLFLKVSPNGVLEGLMK